jgi:small-conductance mechanosensitive channel
MKTTQAIFFFILFLSMSSLALAQQENGATREPATAETAEAKPEAPEKVDVKPVARDEEIENRLNEILDATKRFDAPSANVENGVVFLSGEAKEAEFKTWATDLASNTQDVAAVVNRMKVIEGSIWDFSEAFAELKDFRNGAIQAIPLVIFGLFILVVTWFLAKFAGFVANRVLGQRIPNSLLRWVATRAIMLPVLIFGIYLVLRISGLTQLALTVLGGTGLIGLVIGIAFQDIAENFLASILISVQKPFRVGDMIAVDGHEGIVQRVTTRGTTLMTTDGNHVQIPNSSVYKTTIENFTANPLRRFSFNIGIGYDDSTAEAQQIVLETIKEHSASLNEPAPRVLIQDLGASTVNLKALVWVDGNKNDWMSVRSSCLRMTKQALVKAGISMPDESREVIFPNGVPVLMNTEDSSRDTTATAHGETQRARTSPVTNAEDSPSLKPRPRIEEEDSNEAEGNMESEIEGLQRQAKESWLPGEGEEVLVGQE